MAKGKRGGHNNAQKQIPKADFTGIPQSMIDRWKSAEEYGDDINYKSLADKWRQTKKENEKKLTPSIDLKVGDKIQPSRKTIKDDASIGNADEHAYWNLKRKDGTTIRGAYDGASYFTITKIEKRKNSIKLTVSYDVGSDFKAKTNIVTLTRILKDTDKMRKLKKK